MSEHKSGCQRIAEERARQINEKGYTFEHDANHNSGELAIAAACYAVHASGRQFIKVLRLGNPNALNDFLKDAWPFDPASDKRFTPTETIDLLAQAGAFIAAEIDRLQRMGEGRG